MNKEIDGTGMVQSTIRFQRSKLRELQYYLSLRDMSLIAFLNEKVDEFLQEHRKQHPELVPRGINVASKSRKS
jgi:hypothetical protein